jgi:uncharacterized membrane protein
MEVLRTDHRVGGGGVLLALLMGATFGSSGIFATALIDAGWTPGAAVTTRISLAALILTAPGVIQLRGHRHRLRASSPGVLRRSAVRVVVLGLLAIALCQLAFYSAVQRLDVGVALLLEYLGVVLVVLWMWLRHGQRPRRLTATGSAAALIGLVLVLDLTGARPLDPIGVLWALGPGWRRSTCCPAAPTSRCLRSRWPGPACWSVPACSGSPPASACCRCTARPRTFSSPIAPRAGWFRCSACRSSPR